LVDHLIVIGQPVDDQNFITFLIGGLHATFTPFITSYNFAYRDKGLSLDDFHFELLSFKTLIKASTRMQNQNFVFSTETFNYQKRKPTTTAKKIQQVTTSSQLCRLPRFKFNNDRIAHLIFLSKAKAWSRCFRIFPAL
jgi:hypothetical protein